MLTVDIICRLKEVHWEGSNIIVMEQVKIVPPYGSDNVHATREGGEAAKALLKQIKKIVSKKKKNTVKPLI